MSGASEAARGRSRRALRIAFLALAGLGMGCSLTRPGVDDCNDNSQCQAAFGYGMVCVSGRCEIAASYPRCTETLPPDLLVQPGRYAGWHVYGSLTDHSSGSQLGREKAVRLAVKEIDDQGGLDGKGMGVVFCDIAQDASHYSDGLTRTDAAVASAVYLASQVGVPAIVGPSSSPDTLAVFNTLDVQNHYGTLVISPAATSTALTKVDVSQSTDADPGLLWRTAPPDSVQGSAIAQYLRQSGVKTVSIVQESGAYGEGLAGVFLPAYQSGGGFSVPPGAVHIFTDTASRDAAIAAAGADAPQDVLFISSQTTDAIAFAKAAATSSAYAGKNLFLTDSAANGDFLKGAKSASAIFPRIHGSRIAIPTGSTYAEFAGDYQAAFSQAPDDLSYVANAYDAAWLVFYGSAWSRYQEGGVSGIGIARGLRQVSSGDPVPIAPSNWSKVVTSFKQGQPIDVRGASGELDFDPNTKQISAQIEIWGIDSTDPQNPALTHVATI